MNDRPLLARTEPGLQAVWHFQNVRLKGSNIFSLAATKIWRRRTLSLFEFRIPVQKVAPAIVKIVGRKGTAVFHQLCAARPPRRTTRIHAALSRQLAAFFRVACAACGYDVFPRRVTAFAARNDVIESQVRRWFTAAAILARESIAQKDVEPRKGRKPRRRDVLPQRDHAGQAHFEIGRMNGSLVFGQNIDALEKNRLDRILPGPQRQRKIAKRTIVRIQDKSGTAFQ